MTQLLPNQFLFRYTIPVRYHARLPKSGKQLLKLSKQYQLPAFGPLDDQRDFGEVRMAWNRNGLGFNVIVNDKTKPVAYLQKDPEKSDGLQIWIDTRNTKNTHRASKYCHQFFLFPQNVDGQAEVRQLPIAQAKDQAPQVEVDDFACWSQVTSGGYESELWIPAELLYGLDSQADTQIGFHYLLRDRELGLQSLTVGAEFPVTHDPSLWSTLTLVSE